MAKRGRPVGSKSRTLNPTQVLANRLSLLRDLWFALGPEPRKEMPEPIKLRLYHLAVELEAQLQQRLCGCAVIEAGEKSLQRAKSGLEDQLRARGWSQKQISTYFIKRRQIEDKRRKRMARMAAEKSKAEIPDAETMWEIVGRRAPKTTPRKKAQMPTRNEVEAAYREHDEWLRNAHRDPSAWSEPEEPEEGE
jgi:hypothetical protein